MRRLRTNLEATFAMLGGIALVDTREPEHTALKLDGLQTERVCLAQGDYAIKGYQHRAAIDRKTLQDLVGSFTTRREPFMRAMERLSPYEYSLILVEGSFSDLMNGAYYGAANPQSIVSSIAAVHARYRVPTIFAGTRRNAEIMAKTWLLRTWQVMREADMAKSKGAA